MQGKTGFARRAFAEQRLSRKNKKSPYQQYITEEIAHKEPKYSAFSGDR